MLQRVRHTRDPFLSDELIFYFLPEWSACQSFCELQIAPHRSRLLRWDKVYENQCADKLDGHDLASNNYALFKQYRAKGYNHHRVGEYLATDNVNGLTELVTNGTVTVDSNVPRSIFDRFPQGRRGESKLIEYAALTGKTGCFEFLLRSGALLPDTIGQQIAFGGAGDLVRVCEQRQCSFKGAPLQAVKGFHLSMMRYIEDKSGIGPDGRTVLSMCHFRNKGLHYLVFSKGVNIGDVLASDPHITESPQDVYRDLLVNVAAHNDILLSRVIAQSEGFDVMTPSTRKHSTALHAAAARNAVEALQFLLSLPRVDPNVSDRSSTPLICAASENAWEAAVALLQYKGIDVNAMSNDVYHIVLGLLLWPLVKMAAWLSSKYCSPHKELISIYKTLKSCFRSWGLILV
jgi:hypothetical protein